MTMEAADQTKLSAQNVWIIDDAIVEPLSEFGDSEMTLGERPTDRGTLLSLVRSNKWNNEPSVKALIQQLISSTGSIWAFPQPVAAIDHLRKGFPIPDIIIYDLGYTNLPTGADVVAYLDSILGECVSVVQVYTNRSVEEASRLLELLLQKYHMRLEKPKQKIETTAEALEKSLAERLKKSLSASLAGEVRRLSLAAIEHVLVRVDNLPLNLSLTLLAGSDNAESSQDLDESDLIEMLSVKVSEALEGKPDLAEAVSQYAISKGIAADRVGDITQETIVLLVTHVRDYIRGGTWLFDLLKTSWDSLGQQGKVVNDDVQTRQIIRDFFAFRVYTFPTDKLVRTGDILFHETKDNPLQPPDLYFVITPPCDLAKFWKKTRGTLTLVKMYPMVGNQGVKRARANGNSKFAIGDSITAIENAMVIPSVQVSDKENFDYLLFCHEIRSKNFSKPEGANNTKPITYDLLGKDVHRVCRVSEPFLGGILNELRNSLFRPGIPDFHDIEKQRLTDLFKEQSKAIANE